ncbi:MAG: hypothetical protein IJY50_03790 [Clostridia bacterium]|nr:hypothetical protein [Clostridia bacterium]
MKKIISLLLCFAMLLSAATLLSSCAKDIGNGDGVNPAISEKTVEVDLTDYTIVYSDELTDGGRAQVSTFAKMLKKITTLSLRASSDEYSEVVETEDLEILIGNTNREETVKLNNAIEGYGWGIQVFEFKIVILGTTPFLTRVALDYFVENCLKADNVRGTVVTMPEEIRLAKLETVQLKDEAGEGQYTLVYSDRVDDTVNALGYHADPNPTQGGPDVDFPYTFSQNIQKLLIEKTAARASTFPFMTDKVDPVEGEREVQIGNTTREESRQILNTLEANEYAVSTINGNIVLAAWNDVTLDPTYALFEDVLKGCAEESADGTTVYNIPVNCTVKGSTAAEWEVDFPKPTGEGIQLDGTAEVGDYSVEYIYTGDGISRDSYVAYCQQLEAAGFATLAAENQVEGSSFRTYYNKDTGTALHVYHAAYKHAENKNITDALKSIRIIATNAKYSTLPDAEMLNPKQTYEWRTDPKITQIQLLDSTTYDSEGKKLGNFGMSFVITLADGSFIIYDGGSGRASDDVANLWNTLNELHKIAYNGVAPSKQHPIRIRAWILTHEHTDHFQVFRKFLQTYGKYEELQFDRLLTNLCSASERVNSNNPQSTVQTDMKNLQSYVKGGFDVVTVHTGQVFYFANLKMDVLYTHEDTYPQRLEYFNNSSTVVRTTMETKHKDGTKDTSTCIWLGDVERIGGRRMLAMYGDTLKSDHCQVAHHGHTGVTLQFYETVAPDVLWWPTSCGDFRGYTNESNRTKTWYYEVDYQIAYHLASVKMIVLSGLYNTTMEITGEDQDMIRLINVADPDNSTIKYTKVYDGEALRASSTAKQNSVLLKQPIT